MLVALRQIQAFLGQHDKSTPIGQPGQIIDGRHFCGDQLVLSHDRQILQGFQVELIQIAWLPVDQAQSTQGVAVLIPQRVAGVEPDIGPAHDQRVVTKSLIETGVIDNQQIIFINSMAAK